MKVSVFTQLLQRIDREEGYQTCVIFQGNTADYGVEEILQKDLKKSLVLYRDLNEPMKECCGYYTKFLAVVTWHEENSEVFFKALAEALNFNRYNRVVVIKDAKETYLKKSSILKFFNISMRYKFPNLLLIFKDFYETQNLYQFEMFPSVSVKKINLNFFKFSLYPRKFENLYGYPLKSMPDQTLPRSAVYADENGRLQVKGYIIKFIELFTKYLNATLVFPFKITPGKTLFYSDLYDLTQNELIDIPAGLITYQNKTHLMSHVYEVNKWCLMVPIEKPFSYKDYVDKYINRTFYAYYFFAGRYIFSILLVLSTKVWSLKHKIPYAIRFNDFAMNSDISAGMIGASFKLLPKPTASIRFIYISLFLCGLMYSILTSVQMQSFLTHPYANRMTTLKDLVKNNLKILIARQDYDMMLKHYRFQPKWLPTVFEITQDYEEFSEIQASLNTSYVYPITSPLWFMYNAQQTLRNKPLFRLTNMCYPFMGLMAFVLPPNFLFQEPLNDLILRARDMGLLEFWLKTSYIDLVKMGKIYLKKDRSVVAKSNMLTLEDFVYVRITICYCFGSAFLVFLGEVVWFKISKKILK